MIKYQIMEFEKFITEYKCMKFYLQIIDEVIDFVTVSYTNFKQF